MALGGNTVNNEIGHHFSSLATNLKNELSLCTTVVKRLNQFSRHHSLGVWDWFGGSPMQYIGDPELANLCWEKHGFQIISLNTCEACTGLLFRKLNVSVRAITNVKSLKSRTI